MPDRLDCPSKRCKGRLDVAATGTLDGDAPLELAVCSTCGRVVELTPDLSDHPVLFEE